jgi:hypothetical protein
MGVAAERTVFRNLRLSIVADLPFAVADTRIAPAREESVMRHFLTLASTPLTLPSRMVQPAAKARLIALARRTHALAPGLLGTRLRAVSLSVIAPPADALLTLTERAIEYSIDDRTDSSLRKAGQLVPTASFSQRDKRYRRSARTPRRLEDGNSSGLHLCRAGMDYTARPARARRREEEEQP